nr:hypothetical protein [Salmonella enterica]
MAKKPVKTQEKTAEYTKKLARAAVRKTILPPSRTTKGFHQQQSRHGWVLDKRTPDSKSNNQAGSLRLFDMSLAELNKPAH